MKIKNFTIDLFTLGYLTAILWTESISEKNDSSLNTEYDCNDINTESLERIIKECDEFQDKYHELLMEYLEHRNIPQGDYTEMECAGHDFWLTRNGHGAGFWDRFEVPKDIRDSLTEASKKFGECWVTLGDDGQIYIS